MREEPRGNKGKEKEIEKGKQRCQASANATNPRPIVPNGTTWGPQAELVRKKKNALRMNTN